MTWRSVWPLGWSWIIGDRFLPKPVLGMGEVLGFQAFLMLQEVGSSLVLTPGQLLSSNSMSLFLPGVSAQSPTVPISSSVILFFPCAQDPQASVSGEF